MGERKKEGKRGRGEREKRREGREKEASLHPFTFLATPLVLAS